MTSSSRHQNLDVPQNQEVMEHYLDYAGPGDPGYDEKVKHNGNDLPDYILGDDLVHNRFETLDASGEILEYEEYFEDLKNPEILKFQWIRNLLMMSKEAPEEPKVDETEPAKEDVPKEKDEFTVEAVLDVICDTTGKIFFHTKWVGFEDPKDITWEPLEHFDDVEHPEIQKFLSTRNGKRAYNKAKKNAAKIIQHDQANKEEKFELEKILNVRRETDGAITFEVQWKGTSETTWEPLSSFGVLKFEHKSIKDFLGEVKNRKKFERLRKERVPIRSRKSVSEAFLSTHRKRPTTCTNQEEDAQEHKRVKRI